MLIFFVALFGKELMVPEKLNLTAPLWYRIIVFVYPKTEVADI